MKTLHAISKSLIFLSATLCLGGCGGVLPPPVPAPVDGGASDETADAGVLDAGSTVDAGAVDAGVLPMDGGLTLAQRSAAATSTAENNALCTAIAPFYWEVGDVTGPQVTGSRPGSGSKHYARDTVLHIASASKWIYSTYWAQRTQGALSADDIKFFNFWSGYTHFSGCGSSTTVSTCLDVVNRDGTTNGTFDPATENKFDYGGGHMQKHAALNGLGNLDNAGLAAEMQAKLGADFALTYWTPQLAGGASTSAAEYAKMLQRILSGQLAMKSVLGTHPVCTDKATCALALGSPGPSGEQIHYSIGHWLEDDPVQGDGAFSSAGAFGFYPWIDSTKTLYGIVAREDPGGGSGVESLKCGRLIRKAFVTGTAQ